MSLTLTAQYAKYKLPWDIVIIQLLWFWTVTRFSRRFPASLRFVKGRWSQLAAVTTFIRPSRVVVLSLLEILPSTRTISHATELSDSLPKSVVHSSSKLSTCFSMYVYVQSEFVAGLHFWKFSEQRLKTCRSGWNRGADQALRRTKPRTNGRCRLGTCGI